MHVTVDALEPVAEFMADEWRETLNQPGSGRFYTREMRTIQRDDGSYMVVPHISITPGHRASAPGEPPAPRTYDLQNSIGIERGKRTVRVGSSDEAAVHMEYGVYNHPAGIIVEPRPHARPTIDRTRSALNKHMIAGVRKVQERQAGRFTGGFRLERA